MSFYITFWALILICLPWPAASILSYPETTHKILAMLRLFTDLDGWKSFDSLCSGPDFSNFGCV